MDVWFLPTFHFDLGPVTWGEPAVEPPPKVDLLAEVKNALDRKESWKALLPRDGDTLAVLGRVTEEGLIAHPLAVLEVAQTRVPLETHIDRLGSAEVSANRLHLGLPSTDAGPVGAVSTVTAPFSPGQFLALTGEALLSRSGFENLPNGCRLATSTTPSAGASRDGAVRWRTYFRGNDTPVENLRFATRMFNEALVEHSLISRGLADRGNPYLPRPEQVNPNLSARPSVRDAGVATLRVADDGTRVLADLGELSAAEATAASNVVDGVLLLSRFPPDDPAKLAALRPLLDAAPANAYLRPGDWKPLLPDEWNAVRQVLREAAETVDAVADIMLSESVLQYAGGNPFRAAAAMDAMSTGASPSDTIDVLEAQDGGDRLTHRVIAAVGANPPASAWNGATPRALAEPRIEAWAAAHLGDPTTIVVADDVNAAPITLDRAGLAALDLVFSTDLPALERLLRQRIPELGDAQIAVRGEPGWPAGLRALGQVLRLASVLRSLIAGASPLLPADLGRPTDPVSRDLAAALPELTGRMTALAAGFAAAVQGAGPTLAQLPPDGIVATEADAAPFVEAAYTLAPYGVPLEPFADRPLDVSWTGLAWQAAATKAEAAQAFAAVLAALPADTPAPLVLDQAQEVAGALFGDGFLVVPRLPPGPAPAGDPFARAVGEPAFTQPRPSEIRRFIRDVSTVRPQVTRWSEALLLGGALGARRPVTVAQLAERVPDDPPVPTSGSPERSRPTGRGPRTASSTR